MNRELVTTYRQVRDNVTALVVALQAIPSSRTTYYLLRDKTMNEPVEIAARMIYLNRHAYRGIYRVNTAGKFNVPFGDATRSHAILWESDLLINASVALTQARICCVDFEVPMRLAKQGDVVYCDPTYISTKPVFNKYNGSGSFCWEDQLRLKAAAEEAARRGATVIISNSCLPELIGLYRGFDVRLVERTSCLARANGKKTDESLVIITPETVYRTTRRRSKSNSPAVRSVTSA